MKKADSGEARFEEDPFLTSPVEVVTQQDLILSDTENKSSETPSSPSPLNLPGARSEMEEKVAPVKPSRPKRHLSSAGTIESVNLDAIPLAIARLDNSAAKHKLSIKPKNKRVSRKHRRLVGDRQNEHGGLLHQLSLDQNGHPGEDKPIWQEGELEPRDSEEEKRRQEEYWRDLEAKCKRQKAEAAERRRLEEQRLQALERRLWEENRRQELLEEEEEEEEEGEAESDSMGGRLIPSALAEPQSRPPLPAVWGLQRPSAPTTGVRAAGAPNSCHPAPPRAHGPGMPGPGLLTPSPTSERERAWVSKKETLTNFEGGVGLTPKADSEPAPGEGGVSVFGKSSSERISVAGTSGGAKSAASGSR